MENLNDTYRSLIKGANTILDTLASVWKIAVTVLVGSMLMLGATAMILFFTVLPREALFIDGFIFVIVAAWILIRNFVGRGCPSCTEDIPHWKGVLASFVKPGGTIDDQREGAGIAETAMQVIDASDKWIRIIRQELLSMFLWPTIATAVMFLSVYTLDIVAAKIIALAFIAYVFALAVVVYYGVKVKFRGWQTRASVFRSKIDSVWQTI